MIPFEPHTGHVIEIPPTPGRQGRRIVIIGCPWCSARNRLVRELAQPGPNASAAASGSPPNQKQQPYVSCPPVR